LKAVSRVRVLPGSCSLRLLHLACRRGAFELDVDHPVGPLRAGPSSINELIAAADLDIGQPAGASNWWGDMHA
jgi:hypothetical protein